MSSWQKTAAGLILAYFGLSWLDSKLLLREDIGLGFKMSSLLRFASNKNGSNYTVTDAWYETLSKVNARKKCLINATTGNALTFLDVEKQSNQVCTSQHATCPHATPLHVTSCHNLNPCIVSYRSQTGQ